MADDRVKEILGFDPKTGERLAKRPEQIDPRENPQAQSAFVRFVKNKKFLGQLLSVDPAKFFAVEQGEITMRPVLQPSGRFTDEILIDDTLLNRRYYSTVKEDQFVEVRTARFANGVLDRVVLKGEAVWSLGILTDTNPVITINFPKSPKASVLGIDFQGEILGSGFSINYPTDNPDAIPQALYIRLPTNINSGGDISKLDPLELLFPPGMIIKNKRKYLETTLKQGKREVINGNIRFEIALDRDQKIKITRMDRGQFIDEVTFPLIISRDYIEDVMLDCFPDQLLQNPAEAVPGADERWLKENWLERFGIMFSYGRSKIQVEKD